MVRPADPAIDGAACAEIYAWYVRETAVSFQEAAPTAYEMTRQIEQVRRTHPWLVCEAPDGEEPDGDGRVVGFACATPHRPREAYRWACEVAVYVDREQRGRGVGRELYAALLSLLREQGLHVACAGITLPNEASVGLHEAFGFEPIGVYRAIGWKRGAWHDVGWWQLRLQPEGGSEAEGVGPPPEPLSPARG